MIGRQISHYKVTAKIGEGGMGEVYRATDSKLGREVALKILPAAFAQDPQRMARFSREAQLLASLNHPNIAHLYGLEESGGVRALAMELVEGLTLAERIAQGPVPLEEALPIARQIAEALEYAHERGIIHRDLKPANIKVRPDGAVKVLDFGLAKALESETSQTDASHSPTMSAVATRAGVLMGTAAYMSPEQARGKSVDRRADIWAYGCVLYEMLRGKKVFEGETASDALAAVIRADPDWSALSETTPPGIVALLRRCLVKDARRRLQAIGEARILVEDFIADPHAESGGTESRHDKIAPEATWRRVLPWAVAGLAIVAAGLTAWAPWRPAPVPPLSARWSVEIGAPVSLVVDRGPSVVLSPDGTRLAFLAVDDKQKRQIYVRNVDQLQATPLAGTEGARDPFFSPDGTWIAFFADGKLKKIAAQGGAAVTLCDATIPRGGDWGADDSIVFTPEGRSPLFRVSSAGGKPEPLTELNQSKGELTHRWPQVLRGGEAVLFTVQTPGGFGAGSVVVQLLKSGERRTVATSGSYGRYVPSGHIIYALGGSLFAVPFDLDRMEMTGPPAPFLERVVFATSFGGAQFSFSNSGSLVYVSGESQGSSLAVYWLDREGKFQPLRTVPGDFVNPRLSPDGKRLTLSVAEGGSSGVWVYDWARDTMTRLTFSGNDFAQVWTPDGQRHAFSSTRSGSQNLFWQRADGTGETQRLTDTKSTQFASSWTPDGKFLAYWESAQGTGNDIWVLPIDGDEKSGWKPGTPKAFLKTPFNENNPAFSPDGRWIAYGSTESGRNELYVRPFPSGEGKWMISNGGGGHPRWARNGKELFYRTLDETRLMVASYHVVGGSFQADKPVLWSPGQFADLGGRPNYDLAPDAKRVVVLRFAESQEKTAEKDDKFVLILNVFEELRRRVLAGKK